MMNGGSCYTSLLEYFARFFAFRVAPPLASQQRTRPWLQTTEIGGGGVINQIKHFLICFKMISGQRLCCSVIEVKTGVDVFHAF